LLACLLAAQGHVFADGPEGWLVIKSISFYKSVSYTPIVNKDYDLSSLGYGITHLEGTTWIDDGWGRVVIAGHNPGGFAPLQYLSIGDNIITVSHHETMEWIVYEILIVSDDLVYLNPTPTFTLTLITCWDEGYTWLVINAKRVVE